MTLLNADRLRKLGEAIDLARAEATRAMDRYPPFHSHHEGYGVLLEEVDELWDEVKANDYAAAREEAIQVAAMALRFIAEFPPKKSLFSR